MEQDTPEKRTLSRQFVGFKLQESDKPLLEKLDPHHRQILEAAGSYSEIGQQLGIQKMGTVRSRLNRARSALVALRNTQA